LPADGHAAAIAGAPADPALSPVVPAAIIDRTRPGDIVYRLTQQARDTYVDVTIVGPRVGDTGASALAARAEDDKRKKLAAARAARAAASGVPDASLHGINFVPFGISMFGTLGPSAKAELQRIAREYYNRDIELTLDSPYTPLEQMMQKVTTSIYERNAEAVLAVREALGLPSLRAASTMLRKPTPQRDWLADRAARDAAALRGVCVHGRPLVSETGDNGEVAQETRETRVHTTAARRCPHCIRLFPQCAVRDSGEESNSSRDVAARDNQAESVAPATSSASGALSKRADPSDANALDLITGTIKINALNLKAALTAELTGSTFLNNNFIAGAPSIQFHVAQRVNASFTTVPSTLHPTASAVEVASSSQTAHQTQSTTIISQDACHSDNVASVGDIGD